MIYIPEKFLKIESENFNLIDVTQFDWDKIKIFFKENSTVLKYSAWQDLYETDKTNLLFEQALKTQFEANRNKFILKIVTKQKIIGICSLCIFDKENYFSFFLPNTGVIRFFLCANANGYFLSLELLENLFRFGFDFLKLNRISMYVDSRNKILKKVLERGNMREEGLCKKLLYYNGTWHDQYLYSILNKEWTIQQR